jgi:sterol desaturase/sphingolipid hydroxylase (fatty acid hydroxylase superfamily)
VFLSTDIAHLVPEIPRLIFGSTNKTMSTAKLESGRIFQSPVLEALTKTHIAVPLVIFYGIGAASGYVAVHILHLHLFATLSLYLAGALFFTLIEYTAHRKLYHMGTAGSPRKVRMQYVMHGVHHDHPRDKKRLALPPVVSVVLASLFMGLFYLLLGDSGIAFGGGFMTGYATYLMVHYAVHTMNPPKNIFGVLWKHHNLHHYVGDSGAFGVSSPLWDHIFGTMPVDPRKKVASKA